MESKEDQDLYEGRLLFEDIEIDTHCFELEFNPQRPDLLACGLVDGSVRFYRCQTVEDLEHELMSSCQIHTKACRSISFSPDGSTLYTGSSDRSIGLYDVEQQRLIRKHASMQENSINRIALYGENLIIAGDDEGFVHCYDTRTTKKQSPTLFQKFEESGDYISDILSAPDKHRLLTASGDGYLNVFDMRGKGKPWASSEPLEDDLLTLARVRGGTRVVGGTRSGDMLVWSWENWGIHDVRFQGHPQSIDAMIEIDDKTVLTASSDGLLRLVQIQPNRLIGVIGGHEDPVESIALNSELASHRMVASFAHDNIIRLFDVRFLYNKGEADEEEEQEEGVEFSFKEIDSDDSDDDTDSDNEDDGDKDGDDSSAADEAADGEADSEENEGESDNEGLLEEQDSESDSDNEQPRKRKPEPSDSDDDSDSDDSDRFKSKRRKRERTGARRKFFDGL